MSDNQKQNSDNQAGLKLLRDIFKAACLFNPYFPATLQDDCEPLEEECDVETCNEDCNECCKAAYTEDCDECCDECCEDDCAEDCDESCEDDCAEDCDKCCSNNCCSMCYKGKDICEDKKAELPEGNVFKVCETSLRYYTNDGLIYEIRYLGINKRVANDHDLFRKWYIKIYKDHFLTAYKINLDKDGRKRKDTDLVTCISFRFYAEDDAYTNLALTPWYWDNDMLTFFYKDEDGDKHYVRYFNNEGQISICETGDGIIVTDIISDADREMFITTLKKGINANLSSCNENNDNLSCDSEDLCSGADFDNNIEDVFDSMPDEEVQDECEDNFCDVEEDDEYPEEECDFTGSKETIGDVVRSYGFNVRGQSVRDKNDKHSYAPVVKEAYRDIIYKESKARGMTLSNEEMIILFDYMLKNKLYDYCAYGTKIIISVSYEDMMHNITKPSYSTPCVASSSNLPWFMASDSAFKRIPISWKDLNKQIFVENIRHHYHFDEVILIDIPGTDEEPYLKEKHLILCAFDAM